MHAMDAEHRASRTSFNPHKSTRVGQTSMAAPKHAVVTEAPKAPELPPGQAALSIWSRMLCIVCHHALSEPLASNRATIAVTSKQP